MKNKWYSIIKSDSGNYTVKWNIPNNSLIIGNSIKETQSLAQKYLNRVKHYNNY